MAAPAFGVRAAIPHPISGPVTCLLIRKGFYLAELALGVLEIEVDTFSIHHEKINALLFPNVGDVFVQEEKVVLSTIHVPCKAGCLGAQHARCIPQNTQAFIFVVQQFGI